MLEKINRPSDIALSYLGRHRGGSFVLDEHCKIVSAFLLFLNFDLHINGWVLKVIPPA
jgi:hypothetical protein